MDWLRKTVTRLGCHPHFILSRDARRIRRRLVALSFAAILYGIYDLAASIEAAFRVKPIAPANADSTAASLSLETVLAFLVAFEAFHYLVLYASEFSSRKASLLQELRDALSDVQDEYAVGASAGLQRILHNLDREQHTIDRMQYMTAALRYFQDVVVPAVVVGVVIVKNFPSMVEVSKFVAYSL